MCISCMFHGTAGLAHPSDYCLASLWFLLIALAAPAGGTFANGADGVTETIRPVQAVLGLKDPDRPFPTGSALGILKWRLQVLLAARDLPLHQHCPACLLCMSLCRL